MKQHIDNCNTIIYLVDSLKQSVTSKNDVARLKMIERLATRVGHAIQKKILLDDKKRLKA